MIKYQVYIKILRIHVEHKPDAWRPKPIFGVDYEYKKYAQRGMNLIEKRIGFMHYLQCEDELSAYFEAVKRAQSVGWEVIGDD